MKVTKEIALNVGASLIRGDLNPVDDILRHLPAPRSGSFSDVFTKLRSQAAALAMRRPFKPAFSIFAKGNSKLPFWSFSSMAVLDCPGRGECERWCYSLKGWRNPNALGRQISNSMLMRHDAGWNKIEEAFLSLKTDVVRLFVDGDFHSLSSLILWMDIIRKRPDISVYGYSKSWEQFLDLNELDYSWPSNYLLNLSSGGRNEHLRKEMLELSCVRGEFSAVRVGKQHINNGSYHSRRHEAFPAYASEVRRVSGNNRIFVCSGDCGNCLPSGGHACGSRKFQNIPIAIGIH